MMEESRKHFESWWNSAARGLTIINFDVQRELQWAAWQASRAAIEVDLQKPKQGALPGDYHIGYDSGAESQYESDVESIRAAGLKIKGER